MEFWKGVIFFLTNVHPIQGPRPIQADVYCVELCQRNKGQFHRKNNTIFRRKILEDFGRPAVLSRLGRFGEN